MPKSISIKNCLCCGEKITQNTEGFVLSPVEFIKFGEKENISRSWRNKINADRTYIRTKGNKKFGFHYNCFIKMMWKRDFPDLKIDEVYFDHISLGVHQDNLVWKFGGERLSNNITNKELNSKMSVLAKKLLKVK